MPTLRLTPTVHGPLFKGPIVLAIMDGVGLAAADEGNAVSQARTPNLDRFANSALSTRLRAHGTAVGMPTDDDMGNSEVGHNALGAGRIVDQGAKLVGKAIASGAIFAGEVWQDIVDQCRSNNTPLHFIGLLSDGNVHSHIEHLLALLAGAHAAGVRQAYVHALLDGRDVPKTSALLYIEQLEAALQGINANPERTYAIASGGGRMRITMDRYEADWPMVWRGWNTHVHGQGRMFASATEAVQTMRLENPNITDQELEPFVIAKNGQAIGPIGDGHGVILFNFRGDRMLELTQAFEEKEFEQFNRGFVPKINMAGMTLYDGDTHRPKRFLVAPPTIGNTLSELLAAAGVSQLACSETQKYGHVTYFWNGNRSGKFSHDLEEYIEIPSHQPPFDERPEMRAFEIVKAVTNSLQHNKARFARLNFANGDMVGHTGNVAATVKSVEAVDKALGELAEFTLSQGGCLLITADHGNAEDMAERHKDGTLQRDEHGDIVPKTSHSLNEVPLYFVMQASAAERLRLRPLAMPGLANMAATIALLLGFEAPECYLPAVLEHLGP